jgi:hypothetical protein
MGQVRRTPLRPCQEERTHHGRSCGSPHAQVRQDSTRTRTPGCATMMKPCLDCGTPANGNRCPQHAAQRQAVLQRGQNQRRAIKGGRSKYGGAYARGGRVVRANATVCWLCGGTTDPTDPWQADHIQQGDRQTGGGPLAPAHRSCNIRRRHLTAKGWGHDRIVERLTLLRNGPTDPQPTAGGQGTHSHPGHILTADTHDDPAPIASSDAFGVGALHGGEG